MSFVRDYVFIFSLLMTVEIAWKKCRSFLCAVLDFGFKAFFLCLKFLTFSSIKILQYLHNPGTRKGVYRYILMTYFPVIQTKANIFHVSTLPEPVCDKTTAKKRWSLPRIVFVDVQTTFRYMFPSSASQSLPSDDSKVFCAYNLGIPLPILESKDFKNLLRCLPP